jgi:acetyl-CoA acetyltransferase family protein
MHNYKTVYIVDALRTPVGKLYGSLSEVRTDDLLASLLNKLFTKNDKLNINTLDCLYIGCGNQAGEDNRNIAKMALLLNGYTEYVYAASINNLCVSGMEAIFQAYRQIKCGEAEFCIAGAIDSMSRSPFVISRVDNQKEDSTIGWRFINPKIKKYLEPKTMPEAAEFLSALYQVKRDQQDEHAFLSRLRYEEAQLKGFYKEETASIENTEKKILLEKDEQHRILSTDALSKLPALVKNGNHITIGNSARIGDGAALIALASEDYVNKNELKPIARIVSTGSGAVHPDKMGIAGISAFQKALSYSGLSKEDIGLYEINEAFALQGILCSQLLDISPEKINKNGGTISIGNPLSMGSARLIVSLSHELKRNQACRYAAALSSAALGLGTAIILENLW